MSSSECGRKTCVEVSRMSRSAPWPRWTGGRGSEETGSGEAEVESKQTSPSCGESGWC